MTLTAPSEGLNKQPTEQREATLSKLLVFFAFLLLGFLVIDEQQEEEEIYRATMRLWFGVEDR